MSVQDVRAFEQAIKDFPLQSRVRGNSALLAALGPTRQRDLDVLGWVIGYDLTRLRIDVVWDTGFPEYLAPRYLEVVTLAPNGAV